MKLEKFNYGNKKKYLLYGLILGVGLIVGIGFNTSMAKYKVTQSIKLAEGKITNYKVPDLNVVAMYQEGDNGYQEINDVPREGYELNTTESYCGIPDTNGNIVKDNTIPMEYKEGKVYIGVSKKRTKCYLYFDIKIPSDAKDFILANMPTQTTRSNFNVLTGDTPGTIYKADDNDGESYYFAGAASDNWVKFGKNKDSQDLYWRIIRINGDNTIRIIYQGTTANSTGTVTQLQASVYNGAYNDNTYVGYTNANRATSSYINAHSGIDNSTIKSILDIWYDANLIDEASYIDINAGFCNDRNTMAGVTSGYGTAGYGIQQTAYAPWGRLYKDGWLNNQNPTFKCGNKNRDLYTMNTAIQGNKKLTRPIGLITVDEVIFAGGKGGTANSGYYLNTGQNYWTMSPLSFDFGYAYVFYVRSDGLPNSNYVANTYGVRPVINLRADTQFSQGNGTASNPYVVR